MDFQDMKIRYLWFYQWKWALSSSYLDLELKHRVVSCIYIYILVFFLKKNSQIFIIFLIFWSPTVSGNSINMCWPVDLNGYSCAKVLYMIALRKFPKLGLNLRILWAANINSTMWHHELLYILLLWEENSTFLLYFWASENQNITKTWMSKLKYMGLGILAKGNILERMNGKIRDA